MSAAQPATSADPQAGREAPGSATYASIVARLSSRGALWVGAGWGFAEAMLLFIVPDVWLGLVALFAPRRMLVTLIAITLGAVAGALCLYLATIILGDGLSTVITSLPGIAPADLEQARAELADQGSIAFLNGVFQALPVKLYIHGSALDGIGPAEVAVFTLLNRIERLLVFGLVMALVGWAGRRFIARWPYAAAIVYLLAWTIFYTGFLLSRSA